MRLDRELISNDIEAYLKQHEEKELLRFVAVGSVDDGKSTLIGRLLHDTHGLYEDQLSAVRRASAQTGATRGDGSVHDIDFALVTDGLKAEREQGITIDVAYRYFSTRKRKFIIADTPGHVQYTRNMATGASTADVAVILVDARLGVQTQSRRHAFIASLLGIPYLLVCVNKMDLVGYDRAVYEAIQVQMRAFATRLGFRGVEVLPISALRGDNVVARCAETPWFEGPTVLEHLETVPAGMTRAGGAFRFPVQLVIRPSLSYRGFAGQIASGVVRPGDEVVALPSGRRTRVVAVEANDVALAEAGPPTAVNLRLADEIDVSRGDMLVHPGDLPVVGRRVSAHVVWMNERPLDERRAYLLKHTTRSVYARVERVVHVIDPETLGPRESDRVDLNDIARVELVCHRPIFFDPYTVNHATGAFILIDALTNDTVAAGMILEGVADTGDRGERVSDEERVARLGHRGGVVAVLAPALADARARATLVERTLFDHGLVTVQVDAAAARPVAAAGLVAVVAAEGPEGLTLDGEPVAELALRDRLTS